MNLNFQHIINLNLSLTLIFIVSISKAQSQDVVEINNQILTVEDISEFKELYGITPVPGKYWYDEISGVFGELNGPAAGVMLPGHSFGVMSSDVSNGKSGVFFNGRELQQSEAIYVANLFGYPKAIPGRYWFIANGSFGVENSYLTLGNIYSAIAQKMKGKKQGDNFWSSGLYSAGNYYTGSGGQPNMGYVSVPGYGPISHGM